MSLELAIGTGLTGLGGLAINAPELVRKTPGKTSSGQAEEALLEALDGYVKQVSPSNPITDIDVAHTNPNDISVKQFVPVIGNSDKLASYQSAAVTGTPGYTINPNADRGLLAHELGHIAFGQTKAGQIAQKLRGHPKLSAALGAAAGIAPALTSMVTPGDDDVGTAIAVSTLLSAPGIIDEIEASRRGLAILEKAGMKATPGQRARMAGGLLTYLAAPVATGAAGAYLGNMITD